MTQTYVVTIEYESHPMLGDALTTTVLDDAMCKDVIEYLLGYLTGRRLYVRTVTVQPTGKGLGL